MMQIVIVISMWDFTSSGCHLLPFFVTNTWKWIAMSPRLWRSVNQSEILKWPKWYATARTTTGNKIVVTEMS